MSGAASITVRVPFAIRRRPGRKAVVAPVQHRCATAVPTRADPALVKALARAFRYQRLLDEGRYASISEMAVAEKLDRGYLGRVLQLTLLAPDIGGHPGRAAAGWAEAATADGAIPVGVGPAAWR